MNSNNIIIDAITRNEQTLNLIRPENGSMNLAGLSVFMEENRALLNKLLLTNGALLFRGFSMDGREEFMKAKEAFAGASSFNYVDGNSPRTKVSAAVYTSTEYPSEYSISLHNELSYSNRWPGLLFFFCQIPAEEGGETPIADSRYTLKLLNAEQVQKFETHGVKYTRYLSGANGVGKSWMDTFETQDRSVVEKYCEESGIEYYWEKNSLFLSQLGTGVAQHPETKEKVWFNQANQFHPSGLPEDIYKGLKMIHAKNPHRFPQYAFYGNGEEISEEFLKEVTEKQLECAIKFRWEKGDLLVLDNMLMAHGRMPFKGDRKIYVSMS